MVGITLDEFLTTPEPAPLWRHQIQFPEINGIAIPPAQVVGGSFTFPFVDAEARAHSGSYTYYPQFNNIDAIDVTFLETEDYTITKYLYRWLDLVFSGEDGTYSESARFKRNIVLIMNNNRGDEAFRVIYNGTFPTRINQIDPSENEEYYRVSCNFSVDSNTPQFDIGTTSAGVSDILPPTALRTAQRGGALAQATSGSQPPRHFGRTALRDSLDRARAGFSDVESLVRTVSSVARTGDPIADSLVRGATRGGRSPLGPETLADLVTRNTQVPRTGNPTIDSLVRDVARNGRVPSGPAALSNLVANQIPRTGNPIVDNLVRSVASRNVSSPRALANSIVRNAARNRTPATGNRVIDNLVKNAVNRGISRLV